MLQVLVMMIPDLVFRLVDAPVVALMVDQYRRDDRVVPGRMEYSFIEFVVFVVVLLGATFVGLRLARSSREKRDERLTASSGGWRIRSQLDLDAGSPYNRFPGLALRAPHDVMEGLEDGFEVSYFRGHLSEQRRSNAPTCRPAKFPDGRTSVAQCSRAGCLATAVA